MKVFLHAISRVLVWLLLLPIRFYQKAISPYTPPSCRFTPTCSEYMKQCIEIYGLKGIFKGIKRILRCHPFGKFGYDPVIKGE